MYEIQRMTTRQRDEQQARAYRVLITIAEEVVGKARVALEKTGKMRGRDLLAEMAHRRAAQADRALLSAGKPCDRSGAPARARR
jgi:hypothetical protein